MIQRYSRGDTLIEVLLAVTIFSMVSVLSIVVMNRSSATGERSLETTLVKQQIDSQVEELRAAHQAAPKAIDPLTSPWAQIKQMPSSEFIEISDICPRPTGTFFMTPTSSDVVGQRGRPVLVTETNFIDIQGELAKPYAQVQDSTSQGVWIEKKSIGTAVDEFGAAYQFTVRACWYGSGLDVPMQLDTTVRLYDPL